MGWNLYICFIMLFARHSNRANAYATEMALLAPSFEIATPMHSRKPRNSRCRRLSACADRLELLSPLAVQIMNLHLRGQLIARDGPSFTAGDRRLLMWSCHDRCGRRISPPMTIDKSIRPSITAVTMAVAGDLPISAKALQAASVSPSRFPSAISEVLWFQPVVRVARQLSVNALHGADQRRLRR